MDNRDNIEVENSEGLLNAMNHLRALSEVEKDPAGSDDEEDDSKNSDDLRMFVAVIEKLIAKTWDKPADLSPRELESLMVVQDLASNLLDMKYTEGRENISGFCEPGTGLSGAKDEADRQWQRAHLDGSQLDEHSSVYHMPLNRIFTNNIHGDIYNMNHIKSFVVHITLFISIHVPVSDIRKRLLYDVYVEDKPFVFPEREEEEEDQRRRRKREAEEKDEEEEQKMHIKVTKNVYGEMDKRTKVIFAGNAYKNLEKLAPLWNAKTGNSTALVFIDSEVVSASCDPNASSSALEREPLVVTLKHRRKVIASGRKLLADKETEENGEIRKRDCMRWDPTLEIKKSKTKGGWTTDGCSMANTTAQETTCQCTQLGTYAIMAKIRAPFAIQEEEEWLKMCKWICFGISIALLVFYILVILIKRPLHEQFHIIRLNMAAAALVASVSFCLSGFLYENEEVCRILSILIHMFYTSTGLWLAAEAHALFSALVIGSFGSKLTLHVMVAWVAPACMIGGCFMIFYNYGYDYRCLVGPTASMRWLLVSPILLASAIAFVFSILTCINYGTPAVKKTVIVNELSSATRANFIVTLLFMVTWLCGVFAIVDLGFDSDEIPAFNPIFQILNSCLGIFIVVLIGVGSKHFRYCLCHSDRNSTKTKALNLDPFDIHDKASISNRKKIYIT
ncbi:uncharacterized protein CDAR_308801 [Caerostris darwini]|uniref:G-protein coupled receptors family 2 profile 2 domain-containing protein n=1 Tax=Caerostris darwini TaxID=1538125 RepID=A0AAV4P006_9ARAC|nr:uncharacterized protein CDAR_308801 [Caerostris darwini]